MVMHDTIEKIPVAKYFLCGKDNVEKEVSKEEFISAERATGFYPEKGDDLATMGFTGPTGITGSIKYE